MKDLRATMIAASVLAACSADAWAATRVDYTVDAGVEHNSNILMTPTDPISQRYARAGLGFNITENASALQLGLSGRAEYRDYRDDVFGDTVDGVLSGRMNWIAIPDRLSFSAEDSLTIQPVDALAPNAPGNRQQVNVLSLGPNLLFDWSPTWRGRAELRYINNNAEVTDDFNSQHLAFALSATRDISPTSTLSVLAQARHVDFDDDIAGRDYRQADLFARYTRDLAHFKLAVDAGYSHINYRSDSAGDRTDPLLRADLSWNPTSRSTLTARVFNQFSDMSSDALRNISAEMPATVLDNILTGDSVANASPYVTRGSEIGYEYMAVRSRYTLGGTTQKRDYVDSDALDQKSRSAHLDAEWDLRPNLTFGVFAIHDKVDFTSLYREDRTLRAGAILRYQMARHWNLGLNWQRYKRDSTDPGQAVAQNIVYLNLSYSNR